MSLKSALWSRALQWLEGAHLAAPGSYDALAKRQHGEDAGPRFARFLRAGQLDPEAVGAAFSDIAPTLKTCRILFVPALFSGPLLRASPRVRVIDYLSFFARDLRRQGFDAQIADIATGQPVAANAARLAQILGETPRPLVIVSHSKGGVDTLGALLARPELQARVAAWIALQAPFFGSPIADLMTEGERAKRLSALFLKLYRGPIETLCDLRTDTRGAVMEAHAAGIAALAARVPVLSVPTCMAEKKVAGIAAWRRTATHRFMTRHGLANDAMVPVISAILPGSRYVVLPGLAHGEPALRVTGAGRRFDQVLMLKALIALAPQGWRALHTTEEALA